MEILLIIAIVTLFARLGGFRLFRRAYNHVNEIIDSFDKNDIQKKVDDNW